MINTATKIIKDCLIENFLESWVDDELVQYDSQQILEMCEQWLEDNCEEYDQEWYPIMAIYRNTMSIDWLYLAEYHNDQKVDMEINYIFD